MKLPSPFDDLAPAQQKRAFIVFLVLALLVMVTLQVLGRPLVTPAAPAGIVSFELAGDPSTARQIVASWTETARVDAGFNLGLDYLFLVAYSTAIALGSALVARRLLPRAPRLAALGAALAWAQYAAALLDALENYALIRILLGSTATYWPAVARICAVPKFALVAAGLLYVLLGALAALVGRAIASGKPR